MASLFRSPPKTGPFKIKFRLGGRQFKYSLKHGNETRANESLAKVERILQELAEGRVVLPEEADVVEFVKTDGGREKKLAPQKKPLTLAELFTLHQEKITPGSKMARTATTERIHARHLLRIFGNKSLAHLASPGVVQGYVDRRVGERHRDKPIAAVTISKEVKTLGAAWRWAHNQGHTAVACPDDLYRRLRFPKNAERPRFQTIDEIKRQIDRGHLQEREQDALWECLFLDKAQTEEVVTYFEKHGERWMYLAVLFVAHTGARRSEMVRSEVSDFDFEAGVIKIRERKRAGGDLTFRQVPMSARLRKAFAGVFRESGGRFAVPVDPERAAEMLKGNAGPAAIEDYVTFASNKATRNFRAVLDEAEVKSRYAVLTGFHAFRHSFISNLARAGVDQRVIDELVGHETDAMRKRYRHLFPEQRTNAVSRLFD
jgi:integrase